MKIYPVIALWTVISISLSAQTWTNMGTIPIKARRYAVTLTYNNKAYIFCGGLSATTYTDSCWEYDPDKNSWTSLPVFPGGRRIAASGFVIGKKAYVGLGEDDISYNVHNDFYAFDFSSNKWTKKSNFTGSARYSSSSFSIGNYGYIIAGSTGGPPYLNDAYRYNASADSWDTIAGINQYIELAEGIAVNGQGYVIGGYINPGNIRDIIRYDTGTNTWSLVSAFNDSAHSDQAVFNICNRLYMCTGRVSDTLGNGYDFRSKDVYQYDISGNTIHKLAFFPGAARAEAISFSLRGAGYVISGFNDNIYYNDIWRYTAGIIDSNVSICKGDSVLLMPNKKSTLYKWSTGDTTNAITVKTPGKYWVTLDTQYCMMDTFNINNSLQSKASFLFSVTADSITVLNTSTNYKYIKWLFGDGDSSSTLNPKHKYGKGGIYPVRLIAYGACSNDTLQQYVYVPSEINELNNLSAIQLYPNPGTQLITLEFNAVTPVTEISLINILGQDIESHQLYKNAKGNYKYQINVSSLPNGIYYVKLKANGQSIMERLVKN